MNDQPSDDLRDRLREVVDNGEAAAHLVLGWRQEDAGYRLRRGQLEQDVAEEFLEHARAAARTLLQDRSWVQYDPDWPLPEHEYFELIGGEMPGGSLFEDLEDFLGLAQFNRRQLTKPRFYVVAVQGDGENVLLGRRMASLKVLKQKANLVSLVWDGNTFNQLENSVATFATTFHWIKFRDRLYVLDARGFHAEFRDVAAIQKAVADHVAAITATLPIKGSDLLIERARANVGMASKLARVAEDGIWSEDQDELKRYASQWKIDVDWDDDGLVFDGSVPKQWEILKLLDEDGTVGPVSGRQFESSAKRRL